MALGTIFCGTLTFAEQKRVWRIWPPLTLLSLLPPFALITPFLAIFIPGSEMLGSFPFIIIHTSNIHFVCR